MGNNTLPLTTKKFQILTFVTCAWVLFAIFIGAVVQVTNTGSACPTWFLCNNQPSLSPQTASNLSLFHHAIASIAALLTVGVAVLSRHHYQSHHLMARLNHRAMMAAFFYLLAVLLTAWLPAVPLIRASYLLVTLTFFAMSLALMTVAHLPYSNISTPLKKLSPGHRSYFQLLALSGAFLLFLIVSGVLVTLTQAGSACPDWPLCRGQLFPSDGGLTGTIFLSLLHRFAVVFGGIIIAAVVLQTCRRYVQQTLLVRWASILGLLYLAQIGVGGWTVLAPVSPVLINAIHLTLTAAIWGSLIILGTIFYMTAPSISPEFQTPLPVATRLTARQKAAVYFKLTKPWIMILLLLTTITAMFIAAKGLPTLGLFFFTTIGGALAAGGASVLNSYVDSDIDQLMSRTSRRATVTGLVSPQETLLFGLILSTLSFFVYAFFVNTLSAALSTLGILYYVFFYTLYLKRSTMHNIIIGGAAGAIPPLVGWTAVTGSLDLGALYLFAIIFFWTPPHTWALALLVKKDYAQARVPMLPVVVGEKETTYQIFLYTILLITLSLLPFTFNMLSIVYLIGALVLGSPFIYLAWKLWQDYSKSYSKQLYKFSQLYLALLFILMAIDRSFFV